MATSTFYEDRRYCRFCRDYIHYLQSPLAAYCSQCGAPVQLFSLDDLARFRSGLRLGRPDPPRSKRKLAERRSSA